MSEPKPEPKSLQEAIIYFADPDNCVNYIAVRRWPDGVSCPSCGRKDVTYYPDRRVWQCRTKHPKRQFSVKVGTIFEDSHLGLDKWHAVMWMIANCKNVITYWYIQCSLLINNKY